MPSKVRNRRWPASSSAPAKVRRYSSGPSLVANASELRQWPGTETSGQSASESDGSVNRRASSPLEVCTRHEPERSRGVESADAATDGLTTGGCETGVTGVLGYEDTVIPQLENALLAGHDVIFLGERGQAKTRMIRSLTQLLDEWMPIVAGSEINDDPYAPVSHHARMLVAERGDDTPIEWVHRDRRFGEKLATPDTSIADLIGEVDPIKVAEGRYLSDELTIHYGLGPRTNRGIFAIN